MSKNRGHRIELSELTYDELLTLNERIIERLKFLDRQDAHDAMMRFHPGARGMFRVTKARLPNRHDHEVQSEDIELCDG